MSLPAMTSVAEPATVTAAVSSSRLALPSVKVPEATVTVSAPTLLLITVAPEEVNAPPPSDNSERPPLTV